ncbi:MAG TPA: isoprenylcysteine carboxylmethyltransferase family protein [Candidatus Binatia bacterium]
MPVLALVGFVLFALLAFGWRTWVHWRRTGSSGFRGFSGRAGSLERFAGLLFAVAIAAAPLAAVLDLTGTLTRVALLDTTLARVVGLVAYALGVAGTLWSQLAMGDSWRIGVDPSERTTLVTRGPYRSVRNPIFSFMVLAVAGLALLTPNVLALAAVAALIVAVEIQVKKVEEPYLERTHGDAYRAYRARTGRFVPGIGR